MYTTGPLSTRIDMHIMTLFMQYLPLELDKA